MLKEANLKSFFIVMLIILAIVLVLIFLKFELTSKVISLEKEMFGVNEQIQGTFNLKLKEGELLPSNTRIIVTLDNDTKELTLKEFVEISKLELEEQQGSFFLEGKDIEGEGFGYGFPGHYIVYPNVYFQLRISEITKNVTEELVEENITNETLEIPPLTTLEENVTEENVTEENITEAEENVSEELPEIPPEAPLEEQPSEEPSETPPEESQTEQLLTEEQPLEGEGITEETQSQENQETQNSISGFFIFLFKTFGIWNSFAVMEENANYKIIEASCSNTEPFSYDLKEQETVELVPGSVHTDDKLLNDNDVNLNVVDNKAEVSTNYFESFGGFGKAYLGEEHELNFNLSVLNLSVDEPGTHELEIKFLYQGQELLQETQELEIKPLPVTIKVLDRQGNIEDEIVANDTNIKLRIGKVKVGREIEHELEIEYKEQEETTETAEGITGAAILEQPLPESEISFVSMPNNTIIQIDKPTQALEAQGALTEIFAIEPSDEIEIESATITLEKISTQPIVRILECDNWDIDEFSCDGSWKDSGLEFVDNGTHVSFTTTHFTGYAGGAPGNNSYLVIWDDGYPDSSMKWTGDSVHFYANYTNATSGEPINGSVGECKMKASNPICGPGAPPLPFLITMIYNETSKLYEYNMSFSKPGEVTWGVSCTNNATYDNLSAQDNLTVDLKCGREVNCSITLHEDQSTTGACFTVNANDTVIDCQGYTINYSTTNDGYGIYNYGFDNITVKNCIIRQVNDAVYGDGIYLQNSSNNLITNNELLYNSDGIHLFAFGSDTTDNNNITNNTVSYSSDSGIVIEGWHGGSASNNSITNNNVTYSQTAGIFIGASWAGVSRHNVIRNNYVALTNGSLGGIHVGHSYNTIMNNVFDSNVIGMSVFNSANNTITNNIIVNSSEWAFYTYDDLENVSFVNLSVDGILLNFEASNIALNKYSGFIEDPPSGYDDIGKFLNVTYYWANGAPTPWVYLNISYNESELGSIDESTIRIWKYNGSWINETFYSDTGVNIDEKYVYVNITNFGSIFAPLGESAANPPANCTCTNCSDCTDKLNNTNCTEVTLTADINSNGTCIDSPTNYAGKTFNCQGHLISGNGTSYSSGHGISIDGLTSGFGNITIKNCRITNFYIGIYLLWAINSTLINNTLTSSYYGAWLHNSMSCNVTENTMNSNTISGLFIIGCFNNIKVINNTFNSNGWYGILLDHPLTNSTIVNNTIKENDRQDIWFGVFSDITSCNNMLENNTGSGDRPIRFYNSSSMTLENETFSQLILCNTDNSSINNVTVTGSDTKRNNGILVLFTENSNFTNITSSENEIGIYMFSSSNNNIRNNNVSSDGKRRRWVTGILLYKSSNNIVANNIANLNIGYEGWEAGISLRTFSNNNTIINNTANSNMYGILIYKNSNYNNITNINLSSNAYGMFIDGSSYNNATNINTTNNAEWNFYSVGNSVSNRIINATIASNLKVDVLSKDIALKNATSPASDPSDWYNISKYINMTNNSADSWVNLSVHYNESEIGGLDENSLRIWKYNDSWYQLPLTTVNTTLNLVYSGNVTGFSIFAPMGQIGQINCNCTNCSDCTDKLNSPLCTEVNLIANITDYAGTCIDDPVNFSGKTFNCLGNTIDGTGPQSLIYGIHLIGKSNNTVKNCIIRDFRRGMLIRGSSNNNTFVNNTVSSAYHGIWLQDNSNNNLTDNIIYSNTDVGIWLESSSNNTLINNKINSTSGFTNYGIYLQYSNYNNILNNNATNNTYGIFLFQSDYNNISNNNATSNQKGGIYLYSGSSYNTIVNNILYGNSEGLVLNQASYNNVMNNIATSNTNIGIFLESSSNGNIINNTVRSNSAGWDVYASALSENNTFIDLHLDNVTIDLYMGKAISVKRASAPAAPPTNYRDIVKFINLTNTSTNSWGLLNVSYLDSEIPRGYLESSLKLWKYNGTAWNQISSSVDTAQNIVYSQNISNFSIFAPLVRREEGGGGIECGDNVCEGDENCSNCPEDCHYCGDGCCILNETYQTCPDDCCAEEGETIMPPKGEHCCNGLTPLYVMIPPSCSAAKTPRVCAYCPNGICGLGENYCNCEDCVMNITNCSQLPKLDANITFKYPNTRLSWQPVSGQYLKASILAADKMVGQNNLSNFSVIEASVSGNSWVKLITERLKFLQVIAKVKVGSGECKPECWYKGTRSEGWYDPCTELLIKYDACAKSSVSCCFAPSKSEGWYAVDDCKNADPNINLIKYAQCEAGEYALLCNQSSDVFVKFTQELAYNEPGYKGHPNTSVNWIVYMPPQSLVENNTEELLKSDIPIDYVAYWNPEQQIQYGSARGWLNKTKEPYIITGPFDLTQGHPYFISATYDFNRWTYVGKVPERVTFEFKYGPSNSDHENYIVLPLDTTIKKAGQLCDIRDSQGNQIIDQNERIYEWNVSSQLRVRTTNVICKYINQSDSIIVPGKVYLIKTNSSCISCYWQQT